MSKNFKVGGDDWVHRHLEAYLATGGETGHLLDFTDTGGPDDVPCLILETTGRRSGKTQRLPLIYGETGGNFVIVASRGGKATNPAWFLNLQADPAVGFQIRSDKYQGRARIAEGMERQILFGMMAKIFPPYSDYAKNTDREIPVVILEADSDIGSDRRAI